MKHFFATLFLLVIPILAILVAIFLTVNTPIIITDSGSAASRPFTLSVNPNGSGYYANNGDVDVNYFDTSTLDYKSLVDAIRTKDVFVELFIKRPSCEHSASSKSTQTVTYNWLTSGDTACIDSQAFQQALNSVEIAARLPSNSI